MYKNKPHIGHFGNPVRVLLELVGHPHRQVRPTCSEPRCIEPHHWQVIAENPLWHDHGPIKKWNDPRKRVMGGVTFTDREVEEIEDNVADVQSGEFTLEDVRESIKSDHVFEEIKRRVQM
ncbi:hypothetical protein [Aquibium oceanicum]|nr:hypothetical protein [Aquibium oceanicum]